MVNYLLCCSAMIARHTHNAVLFKTRLCFGFGMPVLNI